MRTAAGIKFKAWTAAAAAALIMSTGCVVGPKYQRPVAPAPREYKEGASPDNGTPNPIGYSNWWLVFQDDELTKLEQQVDVANQDINAAIARVEQAQAYLKVSRSFLFPTLSGSGSASRNREAQNRPNNGNTGGRAATYNDFQASMLLGYEIDFWGKIRHSVEAAAATEQSDEANLHFVRLVAETGLAMNYFGLRELDAEHEVLLTTLQSLQEAEQLTEMRRKGGLASDYDVFQAKTLVDQTDAQAKHIEIQRSQFEHVIAVLTGQLPSSFSLPRQPLKGNPCNTCRTAFSVGGTPAGHPEH